jgi:hypothetical protein
MRCPRSELSLPGLTRGDEMPSLRTVIAGLDPAIHAVPVDRRAAEICDADNAAAWVSWMAGSSPAMTAWVR